MKAGDKVRCIKTVTICDEEEKFTEGKWYEVTSVSGKECCLKNEQDNYHYISELFFAEHFTTTKRLIDVAMEKTGIDDELKLRNCCPRSLGIGMERLRCRSKERFYEGVCRVDCWNQIYEEEKPMFKVGDKARVRSDLVAGESYSGVIFTGTMSNYKGKIINLGQTELKNVFEFDGWHWSPKMLEPINMVRCDSKDCENNDNGLCPPEKVNLIKPVEHDKEGPVILVMCANYKKRNDDRELFQQTIDNRFGPLLELAEKINKGMLANGGGVVDGCGFCKKYHTFGGGCGDCPIIKLVGKCYGTENSAYGRITNLAEQLEGELTDFVDLLRRQIGK